MWIQTLALKHKCSFFARVLVEVNVSHEMVRGVRVHMPNGEYL